GAEGGLVRGASLEGLQNFAPVDVILDPVGASYAQLNLKMLAMDGRWVNSGLMGGRRPELDLAQLFGKRIQLIGSTLRSRTDAFKGELMAQLGEKVWPLFADGTLKAQADEVFSWSDAEAAFERLASNQVNGKVVLQISEE